MSLEIRQRVEPSPKNTDRWKWRVWVEGPAEELDAVAWVRYELHPTFVQPTRVVEDRASKFELKSAGWGEFMIHALVRFQDAAREELPLTHWLRFDGSTDAEATAPSRLRVFLSYDFADKSYVDAIASILSGKHHVNIVNLTTAEAERSRASTRGGPDLALMFIGADPGQFVRYELKQFRGQDVDVVPIVAPEAMDTARSILGADANRLLRVDFKRSAQEAANQLLKHIPSLSNGN